MRYVGVIGAGVMGIDVATVMAHYGYQVILLDKDQEQLESVFKILKQNIRGYGMISPDVKGWDYSEIISRIKLTQDYNELKEAEWIIENITEDIEAKREVYKLLDEICNEDTLFAVNTSCISITKIGAILERPDKVIGMHFMNPVPLKKVIETVVGIHTSEETIDKAKALAKSIGKRTVVVQDSPGFVVNRLSHLFMNEAAFLVQENVATPEQIDMLFKQGYGHKMGPLETADLIGLDTVINSLNVLYEEYQDPKFRCCPLLKKMVDAGYKGRKSKRGFYTY